MYYDLCLFIMYYDLCLFIMYYSSFLILTLRDIRNIIGILSGILIGGIGLVIEMFVVSEVTSLQQSSVVNDGWQRVCPYAIQSAVPHETTRHPKSTTNEMLIFNFVVVIILDIVVISNAWSLLPSQGTSSL